jgi:hypothetical protein
VQKIADATEDEMVLAFLRAEINSPDFQAAVGCDRSLVEDGDLSDDHENAERRRALAYRGFPNQALFQGFPTDVEWTRCRLGTDELGGARYLDYPSFVELSGGTRRIADGAGNLGLVRPAAGDQTAAIEAIADELRAGRAYPELILVGDPGSAPEQLVLMEGCKRATAYVRVGIPSESEVLVGASPNMARWHWF